MRKSSLKVLKLILTSMFLVTFLTSCSVTSYKDIRTGQNNFYDLVDSMVKDMAPKIKSQLSEIDVVLVSDFVNIDKLKNRSKLGFLLSDSLKSSLSDQDIIIKEVELRKHFQFGNRGLNVLSRKHDEIDKTEINARYAVVGTYSITTRSMILFIKFIDLDTGNILSSKTGKTKIDSEILELENVHKKEKKEIPVYAPVVL